MKDKKNRKKQKQNPNKVAVLVDQPQTPTDYLTLRLHLVHVRKGVFGLKDKVLAFTVLIPETRREAAETFQQIQAEFKKKGVELNG